MKDKYLCIIYDGLIHKKSVKQINKELVDSTINQPLKNTQMLKDTMAITEKLAKKTNTIDSTLGLDAISMSVFDLLQRTHAERYITRSNSEFLNDIERKQKDQAIDEELKTNRTQEKPKIFYLCSKHYDCAKDHKNYQGRIYVDEKYGELIKDKEIKEKVDKYVRENDIRTFQWALGKPVWLITRPNCRHFFKAMTVNQVMGNSLTKMLKENKMLRNVGARRYVQTLKTNTKERRLIGEKRNAELVIERYKEKLNTHLELSKIRSNDLLKKAIKKDRLLISRWKQYLNSLA